MIRVLHETVLGVLFVLWLSTIATGYCAWEQYDATPGEQAPCATTLESVEPNWVLVLYAHPKCPCVRAGLEELTEIAAGTHGKLQIRVVFVRPVGKEPGWERTPLWEKAAAIPGVLVNCDPEGDEARSFGAATSGHVILFDPSGKPSFVGGITRARGRIGSNVGERAILALVADEEPSTRTTPVYGCPLFTPSTCAPGEPCRR